MKYTYVLPFVALMGIQSRSLAQDSTTIVTLSPDSITSTSARLRALLSTDGSETIVGFSTNHENDPGGASGYSQKIVSGVAGTFEVTSTIFALVPNTKYVCQVGCVVSKVFTHGNLQYFTTEDGPRGEGLIVPLTFSNNSSWSRTIHFGVHTYATECLDFSFDELEQPPLPPSLVSVEARFRRSCFGLGTLLDLRALNSSAQADTYKVSFATESGGNPVSITWPNLDSLYSGSILMRIGGINVDMKSTRQYDVPDEAIASLTIITNGPRPENNSISVLTRGIEETGPSWGRLRSTVFLSFDTTKVWFEWGTTPSLGNLTPAKSIVSRSSVASHVDTIEGIEPGFVYYFRGVAEDAAGTNYGATQNFSLGGITGVEIPGELPARYYLEQNYPNPFNPVTNIRYDLPVSEQVRLSVFNMLGQEVAILVNGFQTQGHKTVSFDAAELPSGVYVYRISAGTFADQKKLLLIK